MIFLQHFFSDRGRKDDPVLLLWDDFKGHWAQEIIEYAVDKTVLLQCVLPVYTHCCQPADISWDRPLKDRMRSSWTAHLRIQVSNALTCSETLQFRSPGRQTVVGWLREAWDALEASIIQGGFMKIDLQFNEQTLISANADSCLDSDADADLVASLSSLFFIDSTVAEVCWGTTWLRGTSELNKIGICLIFIAYSFILLTGGRPMSRT